MRRGLVPSVAEAAEEARVSRATAYRYFPSQAALIQAAIDELMAQVPTEFEQEDPVERVGALARRVVALTALEEPLLRASLRVALDHWARQRAAGEELGEERIVRGGRRAAIAGALAPVADRIDPSRRSRLDAALAVLIGIEARVVLTDIFGFEDDAVEDLVVWASTTLARAAFGGEE